ncbi:MAG: hypothetical protein JXA89_23880 [Anaerolineae bacterium]|nr:hypothetical protein [Anaerolineae bacterium]
MSKQTRLIWMALTAMSILILAGCFSRPTGLSGTIKTSGDTNPQDLELHVIALKEQDTNSAIPVFVQGEIIAKPLIDVQGRFEAQIRPGDYLLKLFSAQGDLLTSYQISVKRNKMTKVELEE